MKHSIKITLHLFDRLCSKIVIICKVVLGVYVIFNESLELIEAYRLVHVNNVLGNPDISDRRTVKNDNQLHAFYQLFLSKKPDPYRRSIHCNYYSYTSSYAHRVCERAPKKFTDHAVTSAAGPSQKK